MSTSLRLLLLPIAALLLAASPFRNDAPAAAPAFTLSDVAGKSHSLSDYRGKYVVLEWTNFGCPFVRKHYNSGHMQELQKKYTGKDVVWLSICSSAPGKEGYYEPAAAATAVKEHEAAPTAYLLDPTGTVGKLYGARTTPHMFVIDPAGNIIYQGAIDNRRSTEVADIAGATNYVEQALNESMAGQPVTTPLTQPYGCSVKY